MRESEYWAVLHTCIYLFPHSKKVLGGSYKNNIRVLTTSADFQPVNGQEAYSERSHSFHSYTMHFQQQGHFERTEMLTSSHFILTY